ncbi:MAG: HAMP domain-containing sensor histidine kinase [Minisyncoccia bacterium]
MSDIELRDENVLLTLRKHWIIFAEEAGAAFIIGVVPLLFLGGLSAAPYGFSADLSFLRVLGALWLLVSWMALFLIWTAYYLDIWLITDKHIYTIEQVGLFDRKVRTVSLERIEEINVRTEGFLQTFFGYGTIEILTASAAEENAVFTGLANPQMARSLLLDQIEHFKKLEVANEELTTTSKNQEKLLHLVGHEVKGYLTKSAAALASITEGDFGSVPENLQSMAGSALSETRKGVDTVMNILHDSNATTGKLAIEKKTFDVKAAILQIAQTLQSGARVKGLGFDLFAGEGAFMLSGDEAKLRDHVFRNLIDNAIRYTPSGTIHMELTRSGSMIRFEVKDSGVGISPETKQKLFTEGGKGEHSLEVNKDSTGFGLFVAKEIVNAHGGKIWAESAGAGTGSRFIVELPAA